MLFLRSTARPLFSFAVSIASALLPTAPTRLWDLLVPILFFALRSCPLLSSLASSIFTSWGFDV